MVFLGLGLSLEGGKEEIIKLAPNFFSEEFCFSIGITTYALPVEGCGVGAVYFVSY
jgi:hypothetical protein